MTSRKIVLLIGLIIFALMGLFPPYKNGQVIYSSVFYRPSRTYQLQPGTRLLNGSTTSTRMLSIDFQRLFLQWGILFVCMSGILVIFKKEKHIEKNSNGQEK